MKHTKRIARMFERRFGVPDGAVNLDFRSKAYVRARHCTWYVARSVLELSYPEIGAAYDRDHSTVMFGIQRIAKHMRANAELRRIVERVIRRMRKRLDGQRITAAIASAGDVTMRYRPGQCTAQRSENSCSLSVSNLCDGGREPSLISTNVTL